MRKGKIDAVVSNESKTNSKFRRTRHAMLFRQPFKRRARKICILVLSVLTIGLITVALQFVALSHTNSARVWGNVAASTATLTGLFLVLAILIPQTAFRISAERIQFVRRWWINNRVTMQWNEIEQLRWLHSIVVLKRQGETIWLTTKMFRPDVWLKLRTALAEHLAERFDLSNPARKETRNVALKSPALLTLIALALLACGIIVLPITPGPHLLIVVLPILTFALAMNIWLQPSAVKHSWRYPRSKEDCQG